MSRLLSKFASLMVLVVIIASISFATFKIQRVEANETIYIRSDGTIDPATPLIQGDGRRYNFTDDISGEIIVQRSNIIIDGKDHTLQGSGVGAGFSLTGITNVTIWRTTIMNFTSGIFLDYSRNNRITSNIIQNNSVGVRLYGILSANNTFILNSIFGNDVGVEVSMDSVHNMFHCNTFLENGIHARVWGDTPNFWDVSPFGGNYWSNYTGVDAVPTPDGIGDTPHTITANNVDHQPIMGMFTSTCFEVLSGQEWIVLCITVVSDSPTVSSLGIYQETPSDVIMAVSYNVTGPDGTGGFSRVALHHNLLEPPYVVTFDNIPVTCTILFENETISIIYFDYTHSTHEVLIVPEFPSFLILPLLMIATLLVVLAFKVCARIIARSVPLKCQIARITYVPWNARITFAYGN